MAALAGALSPFRFFQVPGGATIQLNFTCLSESEGVMTSLHLESPSYDQ
jgi:hypothetical protein